MKYAGGGGVGGGGGINSQKKLGARGENLRLQYMVELDVKLVVVMDEEEDAIVSHL